MKDRKSIPLDTLLKQLLAEGDVEKVLITAMDQIIVLSGAERALIVLYGRDRREQFQTARRLSKSDLAHPEFEISRTIIRTVTAKGEPVCIKNALADPRLTRSESVMRLRLLSVICIPLKYDKSVFGVVYLDNRSARGVFTKETFDLVREFTELISMVAFRALECSQLTLKVQVMEAELRGKYQFEAIIGSDPKMIDLLKLVSQVADTDATVLIEGESGTGKELFARALHFNSRRKDSAFIAVNCAAIPENLLESELFGHVKGAFTGALKDKPGWFECADCGTIFLDEVSEMPVPLQSKLLRVLQFKEYSRVGSTEIRHLDVRIVAAASKNLSGLVRDGMFREELYYRLNVIGLQVPPLRERSCDIILLARYFLKMYGDKYGKPDLTLTGEAEKILLGNSFPGNCRELENIIQRAVVLAQSPSIGPDLLALSPTPGPDVEPQGKPPASFRDAKQKNIEEFEKKYISHCLQISKGHISRAAELAGLDLKTFYIKMRKLHIDPHSFKTLKT
jgi:transcriptional regulator with GAF, ATPase, and Fis domain